MRLIAFSTTLPEIRPMISAGLLSPCACRQRRVIGQQPVEHGIRRRRAALSPHGQCAIRDAVISCELSGGATLRERVQELLSRSAPCLAARWQCHRKLGGERRPLLNIDDGQIGRWREVLRSFDEIGDLLIGPHLLARRGTGDAHLGERIGDLALVLRESPRERDTSR